MLKPMEHDAAANRASLGGKSRKEKLTPEQRKEIARKAAKGRWDRRKASTNAAGENTAYPPIVLDANQQKKNDVPVAKWPGVLTVGARELSCYVLEDGRRIISRNAATGFLAGEQGGGNLEQYLVVQGLRDFVPANFMDQMIEFFVPGTSAP